MNEDVVVTSVLKQHTVTIDGDVVATQDEGTTYTFPEATGDYAHVDHFTDGTNNYEPGSSITLNEDVVVESVMKTYNVYIDYATHPEPVATVVEGGSYTTPTDVPEGTKFLDTATQNEYNPGESILDIENDLYLETIPPTPVTTYTWTVDGKNPQTVEAGTTITLPTTAQVGYLLEYVDGDDAGVTDDIYSPGADYEVNRNVNFISISSVTMETQDAASMYYKQGKGNRGIRFLAKLTVNDGKSVDVTNSNAFQAGMLMTSEDIYNNYFDEELDLDSYQKACDEGHPEYAHNVKNVTDKTKKWVTGMPAGYFSCGIIYMKDYNIDRPFVARGYVQVNYKDDHDPYISYGHTTDGYSIKGIAQQIYEDTETYNGLPTWKKEIVDECRNYNS